MSRIPTDVRAAGEAHLEAQLNEIENLSGVNEGAKALAMYQAQNGMDLVELQTEVKLMNAEEKLHDALNSNMKV